MNILQTSGAGKNISLIFAILIIPIFLSACGGLRTFHEYARAGDTVAVAAGMKPDFNKDNITVTITPSSGSTIVLAADDPAIRGIINLYPDPISSMKISKELGTNLTTNAISYADTTLTSANYDNDWYQTSVFLDLPDNLPLGLTQIDITNELGTFHSATLDIVEGVGEPNAFSTDLFDVNVDSNMFDSLARTDHATIFLQSEIIPAAVELLFTHDPDISVGGSGQAFIVNPLGHRKNLRWSDDGTNLKILMIESKPGIIDNINDYKFYITGTATNLQFVSLQGFDNNGQIIPDITHTLTNSN